MKFSLRSLLLCTAVLVVWMGWQAEQIHRQRAAVAAIERVNGSVRYRDVLAWPNVCDGLSACLGRDAVANVDTVYLGGTSASDDDLTCLRSFPKLRVIVLTSSAVTDGGLRHLYHLPNIESIDLRFTAVTDAGIEPLRRALPHARILSKSDIE